MFFLRARQILDGVSLGDFCVVSRVSMRHFLGKLMGRSWEIHGNLCDIHIGYERVETCFRKIEVPSRDGRTWMCFHDFLAKVLIS